MTDSATTAIVPQSITSNRGSPHLVLPENPAPVRRAFHAGSNYSDPFWSTPVCHTEIDEQRMPI